ncbi:MAG: calcium-binding protein [Synechococcales cyanobacterium CRU_2_2]|nr:calcium-binding protein [Synechococcales cyanobacterium CRU_2_2]
MTMQLFNEAIYLAENPQVAQAIAEGKYASGYEEFMQVGQFAERRGVIFGGTNGNDTVLSSGQKSSVIGVGVKTAQVGNRLINAEVESLGVGEVDVLQGSPGRNIFYLGDNGAENPSDFYLGNGAQDYATIRYFDSTSEDAIYLSGGPEDYTFETIDGSVNISKNGDLIGVVEGVPKLIADGLFTENGLLLFAPQNSYWASRTQPYFNEPAYLTANADVAALIDAETYSSGWNHFVKKGIDEGRQTFFNGKVGNDSFFYPLGNAVVVSFPITEYNPETGAIKTATTGTGDRDHYHGSFGRDRFLLGNDGKDFYVGKGDQDYVLIGDFDRQKDQLIVAGNLEYYKFDIYNNEFQGIIYKEFQISTLDGDPIARIEDAETLKLVQLPSTILGTSALVSTEYEPASGKPMPGTENADMINLGAQVILAGAGDDFINATSSQGMNQLYGGVGNDTFNLGKDDILFGGAGDDRFFVQAGGGNCLIGAQGSDQFWIASAGIPESASIVVDFAAGEDVIGLSGLGASFERLAFMQEGQNTLISFNGNALAVLNGIQVSSLSAANFAFV